MGQTNFIGREAERNSLRRFIDSDRSEFIAIYGRRRVGKTFLVTETLEGELDFDMTGVLNGDKDMQLVSFYLSLQQSGYAGRRPANWIDAFEALKEIAKMRSAQTHITLFIDELPCLDTPRSGLVAALDLFWNGWATRQKNIKLIVCGSATTWIVDNIIDSHGGLHDRITHEIHLHPFTLNETEQYLNANRFHWNRLAVCQTYMIMGGIPYYLSLLDNQLSLSTNVDKLFFSRNAELKREYDRLFSSLFKSPQPYINVIQLLSENTKGLTRKEIMDKLRRGSGGNLTRILTNLEKCDFLRKYNVREHKINSNNGIYQLTDFYVRFYNDFCRSHSTDNHYWSNTLNTPHQNNWYGLAYERLCMAHIPQIKQALGISGIRTEYYSWRSKESKPAAQVDLIIERADGVVNLCEIKYSRDKYVISADEEEKLRNRASTFEQETCIRKAVHLTFITTYGIKENSHSTEITNRLDMNALFAP